MTPTKPRPFLVVLATTVASQDGVVAAGDSVRNCRTRPGAEQRLLPVIGHPIPGKCEPRFTLSTNYLPPRWSPERQPRWAERDCGPPEAPGPSSQPADFPRHLGLLGRPGGPPAPSQPRLRSSQASFLCLPTAPPSPFLPPGVPTRRVPSARREKQASRACVPPHLSVGRRERKTHPSVPRRSRQGRGREGTIPFPE